MAYNLQSLITILQQILNPHQTRWILDHSKPQLISLFLKAASLKQILENSSSVETECFESQIRNAVHKAEDIIESYMVDQILSNPEDVSFTFLTPDLQEVTYELDSVREQVVKLVGGNKISIDNLWSEYAPLSPCLNPKNPLVVVDEDIKESRMDDQMLCGSVIKWLINCFTFSSPVVQKVMQEHDSVMEQVAKLVEVERKKMSDLQQVTQEQDSVMEQMAKLVEVEGEKISDLQQVTQEHDSAMEQGMKTMSSSSSSSSGVSLLPDPSSKSIIVGIDEDLKQLKDRVIGMQTKLEIIPIVGMGGIGKTTLAQKLYEDELILTRFKSRAWTTISQNYNMKAILLDLLRCIMGKEVADQHNSKEANELKDILYQNLFGRRYMIVLDDIWSTNFWNEIRMYFPDNHNSSRIMLTTRESDVAKDVNSQSKQHEMQLLNKSESWNLLRQEVFGDGNCYDAALERIGRSIASNCGGLPLAIHVIGGLLSKASKTQDVWENIANDVRGAVAEKGAFSNIFSLSYNHLPSHLKPCFLYMGAFPEDHEIKAFKLIRLWAAEGFLKSTGGKSVEEEAEDCLKALVGRNLVSVRKVKFSGRPKSYGIHDLMRDLCLKKAEQQRFLQYIKNKQVGEVEENFNCSLRRMSLDPSYGSGDINASLEFMSLARSFLFTGSSSSYRLADEFFALRLLRVLDVFEMEFDEFPTEILQIVNLRYLAFSCNSETLPSEISRLWNLQTLVICSSGNTILLPVEIWKMIELRHIKIYNGIFDIGYGDWSGVIQENLQTIFTINPSRYFFQGIPNIKKLGMNLSSCYMSLYRLHKLETLNIIGYPWLVSVSPSALILPPSLRKLSIARCRVYWEFMEYLSQLPNLQVLKLQGCEFDGGLRKTWDATQQVFCRLQFLQLQGLELMHWHADETNFPRLRHLAIQGCPDLEGISSAIGEIPTLQTIELDESSPSLVASAQLIIEEQHDLENYDIQLRVWPNST